MTVMPSLIADSAPEKQCQNKNLTHTMACNRAILAVTACGGRAFRREVGLFSDRRGNPRRIGIAGEADVQGWIGPRGRALAIEVKTGRSVRTDAQKAWAAQFQRDGGLYVLARYSETDDGDATIRAALEAER